MGIFDQASKDIRDMEDARVFFEISTGHSVPEWGCLPGGVYGGKCSRCEKDVRSDVDQEDPENECPETRVDRVHDY